MATTPSTPDPDRVIAEIERFGFAYDLDPQFELSRLSKDRRVQVRDTENYAPKEIVGEYAVQMTGGAKFPPIIVTADDYIEDGNTRIGACEVQNIKFFPAIVLHVAYNGPKTTEKLRGELIALAATLNSQGGLRLTQKEARETARRLIALDWKPDKIARAIGLKASSITQIRKEIDAETKLVQVGLHLNKSLRGPSLRALGTTEVLSLNNAPFKALALLADDAGLNVSEIRDSATKARATGSDSEQVDVLEGIRVELGERIRIKALTGVGNPPVSRILRQRLGFVTKYAGEEGDLVETNPSVFAMHREALEVAIAVLTEVLVQQPSS